MFNPTHIQKLTVRQFLEAAGDDNRFYASRALGKRFEDVTIEECITHYIAHAPIGITVYGLDVFPAQPAGDMGQMVMFEGDEHETSASQH